jgi:hypothetical protein
MTGLCNTPAGLAAILMIAAAALVSAPAAAQTGFTGAYAFSDWTQSETLGNANIGLGGGATASISGDNQTLTLKEPNSSENGGSSGESEFNVSIAAASSGILSFDWNFNWENDSCCSGFDVYINSTLYNLADGSFVNPYNDQGDTSGIFTIAVNAGDIITLGAFSADSCCGAATTTITDFSAPAVPEPASLTAFSAGLVALATIRRRRA